MEEMSVDEVVPHLVQMRLLSEAQGTDLWEMSSQQDKVAAVVDAVSAIISNVVGRLPTLCASLVCGGQAHIAERLLNRFQCLLSGVAVSQGQDEDDIMISGESGAQPPAPPPPPDSILITAQVEGSTLTRAQYNTISSLISSLLLIPTSDLVYGGHTLNPLTLHWHCSTAESWSKSLFLYTEMAQQGIRRVIVAGKVEIVVPQRNEIGLLNAAHDGDVESLICFLEREVPADPVSPTGWSSLTLASQNGHVEVVDKLLQHGARVDLQDEIGWSSLMLASLNGHVEVVDKLLQHGARVDLQTKRGVTSLMVASDNGHVEVVDKLLQHGARVDLQTEGNNTALTYACLVNDLAMVSILLKAGAYPNTCNKSGQTPLLLAVKNNNVGIVRELVGARVDVNQMEERGLSALMLCCEEGNLEMTKLLLDSHANPDLQQSSTGYTNLMFACRRGHLDIVMALMEHGADPHIRNIEGMTASDVALLNEFPDVCEVIHLMDPSTAAASQDNLIDQHPVPDRYLMRGSVEEVVRRFRAQMEHVPILSLYDRDKGVALNVPKELFRQTDTFTEHGV